MLSLLHLTTKDMVLVDYQHDGKCRRSSSGGNLLLRQIFFAGNSPRLSLTLLTPQSVNVANVTTCLLINKISQGRGSTSLKYGDGCNTSTDVTRCRS